ncbi:cell division protein FtsZ [Arsenicibacter rosenii]|uniref:Cell division protein FtsZ n=1 Tax=Arsenicibacter rosenii TaxID=1750698 RepID=A0A1S2VEK8_9BACT|nr:cell division protein FtsZ [Arsenicibacter rosenii]OIN57191.1 cell division protein FtsZ [Arsenicibacter rosenii]
MLDHGYTFDIPNDNLPIIKVIGVGGAGSNAVKHMVEMGVADVEFAICNTDRQALLSSPVKTRIQLGQGLGAGTDAEVGRESALSSIEELRNLLREPIKMVFITAGMGGGTGTGAAPVIAELAREMGLLTVAVVTAPNRYEGLDKKEQAMRGIEALKKSCDTVLVVLNDKLAELYGKLPMRKAFAHADNVLATAVKSIAEIITTRGDINADFMDVKKVLEKAGQSVMGAAEAEGEDRALLAIQNALNSPLLNDRDIRGAKRILLTIASSEIEEYEATVDEQEIIANYIIEKIGSEARMFKLGAIFDKNLGPKLRVTVIAAGFDTNGEISLPVPPPTPAVEPEPEPEPENVAEFEEAVVTESTPAQVTAQEPSPVNLQHKPVNGHPVIDLSGVKQPATITNGGTTIYVPQPAPKVNVVPQEPVLTDIYVSEEKQEVNEQIQRMLGVFIQAKGRYQDFDMDSPAYLRHKVVLHDMMLVPDHELIRVRLND